MGLIETNIIFKDEKGNYFVLPMKVPEHLIGMNIVGIGNVTKVLNYTNKVEKSINEPKVDTPKIYESKIPGTSRLIRQHDKIFIAKRKNNMNDSGSVCINDNYRDSFFATVRNLHPGSTAYAMYPSDGEIYNSWCKIIDNLFVECAK